MKTIFSTFYLLSCPYSLTLSDHPFKKNNNPELAGMLHVHCRRQKADLERKGCSGSLRIADHLILLAECINLADKILRLCISENL